MAQDWDGQEKRLFQRKWFSSTEYGREAHGVLAVVQLWRAGEHQEEPGSARAAQRNQSWEKVEGSWMERK